MSISTNTTTGPIPPEKDIEDNYDRYEAIRNKAMVKRQNFYNRISDAGADEDEEPEKKIGAGTYELKHGQRQPMNQTAKNPMLELPQVLAMRFFGQSPLFKVAMDQIIAKPIGVYGKAGHGAGMTAFNFGNLPTFSGSMQLTDVVSKVITGGISGTMDSTLTSQINSLVSTVAGIAGAQAHSLVDLSKADNIIPVMNAMSAAFANDTKSPFSNDLFSDAVKMANAVQSHLQNLAGGQASYQKIVEDIAMKSLSAAKLAPNGALDSLGNIVGSSVSPIVKEGTQILAHIVKKSGQF